MVTSDTAASCERFFGTWILDVQSCRYQQGEPPQSGRYHIAADGDDLVFSLDWVDADGQAHAVSFRGRPDGSRAPFNGGPLADALAITLVSASQLNSSAFRGGVELMSAERTLSGNGQTMHIVQTVKLPDGTAPANHATYYRAQ